MLQIKGRRYDTGESVCIETEGDRIRSVAPIEVPADPGQLPLIAPGLFDLQINGHGGTWFSDESLTPEKVIQTLEPHYRFGITRLLPTLVTASHEAFISGFTAIRKACEQERWVDQMVAGCHQEGPYIAREDGPRGAHPLQHVRAADWDEFCCYQEASGGRIRLVTLAAEAEGAVPFIRKAVAAGITIAIGHTGANSDQIAAAAPLGVSAILKSSRMAMTLGETVAAGHIFDDMARVMGSEDAQEGVRSFMERREAVFKGR
mgnify:CR=1 FL=1